MKFNLLDSSYICISGTVNFTIEDIENLLDNSCTVTISGVGNDDLYIDCDLVDRIGINEIHYYFSSTTDSGTVASGVNFYYKNDEPVPPSGVAPEPYLSLTTNIGAGYYYSTVPGLSAPRYIKLNHDVSNTALSGTVIGFEVMNNDDVINFGPSGNLTSSTTLTSLSYLNYNDYIKEIEVYNSGSSIAIAHVFIDPQYNNTDELLSISASESGPWVFARNTDYIISNGDNWDCGQYNNTTSTGIADGKLRLDGVYIEGTYITPIFKNDSVKLAYIDMLNTSVSGSIIAVDNDDYTSTIQIRSSSSKPIDYNVYRKFFRVPGNDVYFYYKDYLLTTDTEVYNSLEATGIYFYYFSFIAIYDINSICYISNSSSKCFYLYSYYSAHSGNNYSGIKIFLLSSDGILISYKQLFSKSAYQYYDVRFNTIVYYIEMGYNDDVWFYLWQEKGGSGDITSSGYYLLHYNSNFSLLYREHLTSDFIIGCDVVKDNSGALWYSRTTGTQAILKISSTGEILLTYDSVTDVGRLCSTYDGGCWFIDDDSLYKLNSDGKLEDSITNLEITNELTWVMRDESDSNFLWIVDGAYIRLISIDNRVFKSIYLGDFSIERLYSVTEGLVVYCTEAGTGDQYMKFIKKTVGGVTKSILNDGAEEYGSTNAMYRGLKTVSYDNQILGNMIPLSDDPVWNSSLPWNKAVTNNVVFPREKYNQLKLTLRRPSTDIDSPTVESIYYQDNVELVDIYPGQSKTLYLRISLPDGVTIGGDYESNLRVWWELPVV